jgi:hypothetical protein
VIALKSYVVAYSYMVVNWRMPVMAHTAVKWSMSVTAYVVAMAYTVARKHYNNLGRTRVELAK